MIKWKNLRYPAVVVFVFLASFYFRFYNLGYSDFQGDEVSAQDHILTGVTFKEYLLTRVKPPGHFIITKVIHEASYFGLREELVMRIPFAIAGFLAVVGFYLLLKKHFSKHEALLGTFLFSLNGLLLAFSQIVQYQSFVILLSIASIYLVLLDSKKRRNLIILLAGILSGGALLFHYDSASFIIPIFLYLLFKRNFKQAGIYIFSTLLIASIYYIPFVLGPNWQETSKYLIERRLSGVKFEYDQAYYTLLLLKVYIPKEYLVVLFTGVLAWMYKTIDSKRTGIFLISTFILLTYLRIARETYSIELVFLSGIILLAIAGIIIKKSVKRKHWLNLLISLWLFIPLFTYFLIFRKPLTHFYTYIPPLIIASSIGIISSFRGFTRNKWLVLLGVTILTLSTFSYNHNSLIENDIEFPFENESYLFGKMYTTLPQGGNIAGVFGFPHFYDWREIRDSLMHLSKKEETYVFATNTKGSQYRYYINSLHPHNYSELKGISQRYLFVETSRYDPTFPWTPEGKVILEKPKYRIILVEPVSTIDM